MSKLDELREAVAVRLRTIPDWQVSAQFLASPSPPCAHVLPGEITYHRAMGNGHADWNLLVQVFVGMASEKGAQMLLDEHIADQGARSVLAAIEGDRTLGGAADDVIVKSCTGYRRFVTATGTELLGADFNVLVLAGS